MKDYLWKVTIAVNQGFLLSKVLKMCSKKQKKFLCRFLEPQVSGVLTEPLQNWSRSHYFCKGSVKTPEIQDIFWSKLICKIIVVITPSLPYVSFFWQL